MILKLALRNARRNVRRTLLTACTVVFGTALLTVAMAWLHGVMGGVLGTSTASIGHVRVVDPDYAERERLMPLYENIPDVAPLAAEIAALPGVAGAYPVLRAGVAVSAGDELGDAFGLAVGAPLEWYSEHLDLDELIVDGGWFTGGNDEIVLGAKLAEKADASVGDEVLLLGQTQDGSISPIKGNVVGIAAAGYGLVDQQAFVSLERMQWLTDIEGGAIELLVYGDSHDDADDVGEAVAGLASTAPYAVQPWTERDPWASMMGVIGAIQGIFSFIMVFITALAVWNTMMMSVLERTSEIGVLRAMGLTRTGTVLLFVVEAMMIATLGGAVGVCVGALPAYWLEVYGITVGEVVTERITGDFAIRATMHADLTPTIMLQGFLLGLTMAIAGSLVPSLRAANIQPVTAMRTGR